MSEHARQMSVAMHTALYANSNYDSDEGRRARTEILEAFEENLRKNKERAIVEIYGGKYRDPEAYIDPDDPFFRAMDVPESVMKEALSV